MIPYRKASAFFTFSFPSLIAICCILPLGGLFICEMWCLLFAFETSTTTICKRAGMVRNFLPSISEATGGLSPQKYIWRFAIALHVTPRFVIATGYYNLHQMLFEGNNRYMLLSKAAFLLHIIEILALVGLSFVSSSEDYDFHEFCFCTFMACATLHMITLCILHNCGKVAKGFAPSPRGRLSLRCKQMLFAINIFFFCMALYFFFRHNEYCEDGVYSLFAICEIVVVVSNIAFHGTAILDFHNSHLFLQDMRDS